MKPVFIRWVDSSVIDDGSWLVEDDLKSHEGETLCDTLGWIVKENGHSIYVAGHSAPEQIGSVMQIPRVAIKEIKELNLGVQADQDQEVREGDVQGCRQEGWQERPAGGFGGAE